MSRIGETNRAYKQLVRLLDREIRRQTGAAKELEKCRETLDVAFYLLGWSQFEYLVRQAAGDLVKERSRARTVEFHAWNFLRENLKNIPVRLRLDLIFHQNSTVLAGLKRDYEVRNEAAHNYKTLPNDAKDIASWLEHLEELVSKFG